MGVAGARFLLRYKDVSEEKTEGATFTPRNLADFVARQIVSGMPLDLRKTLRILDPAVGEGALLLSLIEQLEAKGYKNIEVHGFDTNASSLAIAEKAIRKQYPSHKISFRPSNFLEVAGRFVDAPLLADGADSGKYDLIIANPPYVRTQIMGASTAQALAEHFGLTGRVDLYYAFILGIIEVLATDGIAGVIVSNRFMTTKSGAAVRKILRHSVQLDHVWDLGDTRLFSAAVLPAVLRMRNVEATKDVSAPRFTSIYETTETADSQANDVIDALSQSGTVSIEDGRHFKVAQGTLDLSKGVEDVWRVATGETDAWLATVERHTWRCFGDIGNIRVGIKTCADKVFISSAWSSVPEDERPELLRPLTTHHMGRRFRADQSKALRHVVYPHRVNEQGKREAIDLAHYPRSAAYFEQHRTILSDRSYVSGAGRNWYEIWVPQDPEAWQLPKLVFRDISEKPIFWIDLEGSVVNGDCYWLVLNSGLDAELLWLALAIANSSFIEAFYDHRFNNKLYAGRRRFITQYVEGFPLPDPALPTSQRLIEIAKDIYKRTPSSGADGLERELDDLVSDAFGVGLGVIEEVAR